VRTVPACRRRRGGCGSPGQVTAAASIANERAHPMTDLGQFLAEVLTLALIAGGTWLIWFVFRRERFQRSIEEEGEERCGNCGYDVRYSRFRCPECGEPIPPRPGDYFPLRDDWSASPIEVRRPRGDELPVVVHHTSVAAEATLIMEQFTARGIHCRVNHEQSGRLVPYEQQTPGDYTVTVWSGDEDDARVLLEHLMRRRPRDVEDAGPAVPAKT